MPDSSPPPAPSPATTPGICLWCGEKPRAATSDLYCAECAATTSGPASDAPAPRPTPNFGQCGEHVGVHAMRLDCRGWHPRPDYQPPAASPAQEATPPREWLAGCEWPTGVQQSTTTFRAAPTPEASAPEPESFCRDCADENGICPHDGHACGSAAPAREASSAPGLTAREADELANRALMFMATYAPANDASQAAMAAVHRLSEMARRAAPPPSDADTQWAIRNDVLAHAAYTIGRQESRATVAALTAERTELLAKLNPSQD